MANTNTRLSQNCTQCNVNSSCARCNVSNTAQCYSCMMGWYLNGSVCDKCNSSCASCLSSSMCTTCASGYVAVQSGGVSGNMASGLLNCTLCQSPCVTCIGSSSTCTSCESGFSLKGSICISNFNYQIDIVFNVTLPQFENNYLSFINQVASAAGTSVQNILV